MADVAPSTVCGFMVTVMFSALVASVIIGADQPVKLAFLILWAVCVCSAQVCRAIERGKS